MKVKTRIIFSIVVLLLGMPLMGFAGEIAIIVNAENTVERLTPEEVKRYILKESVSWPNGKKVRSVDRKGSPPERTFYLKNVVKMSDEQLEKYWVSQRYSKGVPLPPKLSSEAQIIEYVQAFKGGISYVNAKSIGADLRSSIKIVATFPMN